MVRAGLNTGWRGVSTTAVTKTENHYSIEDLNPRSQSVKQLEMTLLRAFQLIDAFDKLEDGQDWTDVPGSTYRKIIGERYEYPRLLEVVYERWRSGRLYSECLDLAANLPPAVLERKEIADGLDRLSARIDNGRPKRTTKHPATRARRRSAKR